MKISKNILSLILGLSVNTFVLSQLNVATTPKKEAIIFSKNRLFEKMFPWFEKNYQELQKKCTKARNIPREEMPVIEPKDIERFQRDIRMGNIDIFKPYAFHHELLKTGNPNLFPKNLKADERGRTWLMLGMLDGSINDDKIPATIEYVEVDKLIPTQSQIWLNELIDGIVKYGLPKKGSSTLESTIIISKENYILDGHHRYGQVMLTKNPSKPSPKMKALRVPLDIDTLIKMGRSYGNAIGNKQNK